MPLCVFSLSLPLFLSQHVNDASGRRLSVWRLWRPLSDKGKLGRPRGCGWIKQALFIGPLLLCSALITGYVWDCSLKCLWDLLSPRRREPLRPHTGSLQSPQRKAREEADTLTVHMLSLWIPAVAQFCICINSKQSNHYFLSHSWPLL